MPSTNDRVMYDLYGAGWEKEHPVLSGEDNCVCNQCLENLPIICEGCKDLDLDTSHNCRADSAFCIDGAKCPDYIGEGNCGCKQCLPVVEEIEEKDRTFQEWVIPSRWHIDDVKAIIKGSEHKDKPMPSDEKLMEYLLWILKYDYWVESINEELSTNLDRLFEKKEEE